MPRFAGLVTANAGANDFRLFYVAAEAGLRWGWSHMYDPRYLDILSSGMGEGDDIRAAYTYANPPLVAWLAIPLTVLPLAVAYYAWTVLNVAAFGCAAWLAAPAKGFSRIAICLASLAVWPTVYALERGQPVPILFACAVGAWWMAARNRQIEAGMLLALSWAIKPQDVLVLPLVFAVCGYRRALLWWLLTSTVLWTTFLIVLGSTGVGTYLGILVWVETSPQHLADTYAAIVGLGPALPAVEGGLIIGTVVAVWRWRRNWDTAFAIGLLGTVMTSLHVHEYDYVGLVVATWLALRQPIGALELVWLAAGALCLQILSIGDRFPVLLWQPLWCAFLAFRSDKRVRLADGRMPGPPADAFHPTDT